jgi:hypothetical protein
MKFLIDDARDWLVVVSWALGIGMIMNGIVRSCRQPDEIT